MEGLEIFYREAGPRAVHYDCNANAIPPLAFRGIQFSLHSQQSEGINAWGVEGESCEIEFNSEPRLFRSSEPIKTQVSTYRLCFRTSIWPFRTRTSRHGCGCTAGPSSTRPSSSANREA